MPRGKRIVFFGSCTGCLRRLLTVRFHKQDKQGVGWKEHASKLKKYCPGCRKRQEVKCKEEKHSS